MSNSTILGQENLFAVLCVAFTFVIAMLVFALISRIVNMSVEIPSFGVNEYIGNKSKSSMSIDDRTCSTVMPNEANSVVVIENDKNIGDLQEDSIRNIVSIMGGSAKIEYETKDIEGFEIQTFVEDSERQKDENTAKEYELFVGQNVLEDSKIVFSIADEIGTIAEKSSKIVQSLNVISHDLDKNLSEISNKIVNGAKENNEANSDYVLVSDSFMQSFKEISDDINKQIKQLDGIRGNIDSATYNFAHGFRKGFFGKKESNFVVYEIESQFEGIQEAFDEINKNSEKMTHQRSVTSC